MLCVQEIRLLPRSGGNLLPLAKREARGSQGLIVRRKSHVVLTLLQIWFSVGVVASALLMLFLWTSLALPRVFSWFIEHFNYFAINSNSVILLPGFNRPFHEILYIFSSMVLSLGFHEGGHALCASILGIPVSSITFFCYLGFIPGAKVNIPYNLLKQLSFCNRLKVILAGIWHNLVLCLLLYFLCSLPIEKASPIWHNNGSGATFVGFLEKESAINVPLEEQSIISFIITPTSSWRIHDAKDLALILQKTSTMDKPDGNSRVELTVERTKWDDPRFISVFAASLDDLQNGLKDILVCDYSTYSFLHTVFGIYVYYVPYCTMKLATFCFNLSFGMALLNVAPFPGSDGMKVVSEIGSRFKRLPFVSIVQASFLIISSINLAFHIIPSRL